MKVYSLTVNDMQNLTNDVATLVINQLASDGVLTEDRDTICARYAVLVFEKGMMGKFLDKLLGTEDNVISYRMVKL